MKANLNDITEQKQIENQLDKQVKRLQKLSELSMTLAGDPLDVFKHVAQMIGELLDVPVVCLSEIRGNELYFLSIYNNGNMITDAGSCPISITPCSTVRENKDIRIYQNVIEKFPEASFLKTHNAFSYCGFPSLDSNGNVVSVTCLLDDKPHEFSDEDKGLLRIFAQRIGVEIERKRYIADRKRMEDELTKAQKLESIGTLAGGIAHDFSNSLQGILSNIDLAKTYANPKDEIYRRLAKAEEIALNAKNLPKQLLTFSRGGAPVKKAVSVSELINDSISLTLSGSNVRCEVYIPDGLKAVEADRGQTIQVINNLLINADHAMPDGGVIKIKIENINIKANPLSLKEGEYVQITIEDQGTGIPKEHLQKIFDPYFTTKEKGGGLGLAIAYSIIRKHDGHITAESIMEVGTTFHVYLPASREKAMEKPVLSKVKEKDMKKMPTIGHGKILLMDDEDMIRVSTSEHLKRLGYEAETAEDGSEAIKLYKRAMKSGKPFDAVVMDLTIPGGMGGEETIKKLLEIDPNVKGIVASGYFNESIMANFREYGFSGVIAKPYEIHELNGVLQEVINAYT